MTDDRQDLEALVAHLLALGGDRVVDDRLATELEPAFAADLLARGVVTDGAAARLVGGLPSQCHENALAYTELHPAATWWTGFALSADGAWRVHSWARTSHGGLVETTERRLRYFGLPAALDPVLVEDYGLSRADIAKARRVLAAVIAAPFA